MTTNSLLGPQKAFPNFRRIRLKDFLPALDQRLAETVARAEAIKASRDDPSFANTIAPLESLFHPVADLRLLLGFYNSNMFGRQSSAIAAAMEQKVAATAKALFQDPVLTARFKSLYDRRGRFAVDDDDRAIMDSLYQQFENNGAFLKTDAEKARLKAIDEDLIRLAQAFTDNNKDGAKQQAVHITDRAELAGLGDDKISSFAAAAQKAGITGWLIVPERLMVDEMLEQAENGAFREKIFNTLNRIGTQAPYDNEPVLKAMQQRRHERARLLGYPNYAVFARSRHMYKDLGKVQALMNEISAKALPQFEKDMRALEIFSRAQGGPAVLKPWDVAFWAERQRKALYGFDAAEFSSYLEADRVMDGLIAHEEKLLGVEFRRGTKHSSLHPDIRVYEVFNKSSGALQGVLHVDLFARPRKAGGAWVENIQMAGPGRPAIASVNLNLAKPADPATPCRMSATSVETLYHEFGHAMHAICGGKTKYRSLQGLGAPSDFVELPSMINESWALRPELLTAHAVNSATGRTVPPALLESFRKSSGHFGARDVLKLVQNSLWDFAFHTGDPANYKDTKTVQDSATLDSPYAAHVRPYPLTRFGHLFSEDQSMYAAGYFNYMLADILAKDGATLFQDDAYEPKAAALIRALIEGGSGGNLMKRYIKFRGREATPDAMLRHAGIMPA